MVSGITWLTYAVIRNNLVSVVAFLPVEFLQLSITTDSIPIPHPLCRLEWHQLENKKAPIPDMPVWQHVSWHCIPNSPVPEWASIHFYLWSKETRGLHPFWRRVHYLRGDLLALPHCSQWISDQEDQETQTNEEADVKSEQTGMIPLETGKMCV